MTGDGETYFTVDSEDTFNMIVNIEQATFNEADHWGGFQFNVSPPEEGIEIATTKSNEVVKVAKALNKIESSSSFDGGQSEKLQGAYQNLFHYPESNYVNPVTIFKKGDRVSLTVPFEYHHKYQMKIGEKGTVVGVDEYDEAMVDWDKTRSKNLELLGYSDDWLQKI